MYISVASQTWSKTRPVKRLKEGAVISPELSNKTLTPSSTCDGWIVKSQTSPNPQGHDGIFQELATPPSGWG